MDTLHLVPDQEEEEENDDLYSGYDFNTISNELEEDPDFQRIIKTGYAQRPPIPPTGGILQPGAGVRAIPGTTAGFRAQATRPATGVAPDSGQARPMTGVTAAGFSSVVRGQQFDPLNQSAGVRTSTTALEKSEDTPQDVIKKLERKVNALIEESAEAGASENHQLALDLAMEAGRKERMLCKQREQAQTADQINLDLTYCVLFNLANQYHANKSYSKSINTYLLIVKNKLFSSGGRLRVNMGNIFVEQRKYPQAIKMYRMALDQIPDLHKGVRFKILQNIGVVFVKMGQYADAITSFEHIMEEQADFTTALNLALCYYAIGDRDKLKKCFHRMLQISSGSDDDDRYFPTVEDDPHQRLLIEAIKDDSLRKMEKQKRAAAESTILTAAKLVAPVIEASFAIGFDWCIERVKESQYSELASELEMTKALTFLKQRDIPKAIETFKECGKKDSKMAGTASTNLSFVYFLENEVSQAEKYADKAIALDKYNPHALVNKGICMFAQGHFDKSREYFHEALSVEASCSEAQYNLGLSFKKLGHYQEALDCFFKLHTILKNSPQVIYHIADLFDKLDDLVQASEWFMQLTSLVPTDPRILQRLGEMYDGENDRSQAFHYHFESFQYCPTSIEVISWLGAYYMDSQFADKAVQYFERAALIQPTQINWQLMVASCYRKTGSYQQALQCYKLIHARFPDNLDCLKFLVRLCSDLGLKEAHEYSLKLRKVEKAMETRRQRDLSSGSCKSSSDNGGGSKGRGNQRGRGAGGRILSGGSDADSGTGSAHRKREIDASYADPLGELPDRPRTARQKLLPDDDEFQDAEDLEDLLPE